MIASANNTTATHSGTRPVMPEMMASTSARIANTKLIDIQKQHTILRTDKATPYMLRMRSRRAGR